MNPQHTALYESYVSTIKVQHPERYKGRNVKKSLRLFFDFCENIYKGYENITGEDLSSFRESLVNSGQYKGSSVSTIMVNVSWLYRYLCEHQLLNSNPFKDYAVRNYARRDENKKIVQDKAISVLTRDFVAWLEVKGFKKRGYDAKERSARYFCEWLQEQGRELQDVTVRDALAYREHIRLSPRAGHIREYNAKTVNIHISNLRLLFRFLREKGKVAHNPFADVEMMKQRVSLPKNILTIAQTGTFLSAIPSETRDDFTFRVIVETLYSTGMRISELLCLKVEDINLDEGYVFIREDKENQERRVPLTEISVSLLRVYLKQTDVSEKVFLSNKNEKTAIRWINARLERICKEKSLPRITCHGIRHMVATHLLSSGADIRQVQEYLGHRNIRNTEIYTHVFPEELKETLAKTHPRERE